MGGGEFQDKAIHVINHPMVHISRFNAENQDILRYSSLDLLCMSVSFFSATQGIVSPTQAVSLGLPIALRALRGTGHVTSLTQANCTRSKNVQRQETRGVSLQRSEWEAGQCNVTGIFGDRICYNSLRTCGSHRNWRRRDGPPLSSAFGVAP